MHIPNTTMTHTALYLGALINSFCIALNVVYMSLGLYVIYCLYIVEPICVSSILIHLLDKESFNMQCGTLKQKAL